MKNYSFTIFIKESLNLNINQKINYDRICIARMMIKAGLIVFKDFLLTLVTEVEGGQICPTPYIYVFLV